MAKHDYNEADASFVADMIPHHEMAIEMAETVLADGENAEVRTLAEGIVEAQAAEVETLREWQEERGIEAAKKAPKKKPAHRMEGPRMASGNEIRLYGSVGASFWGEDYFTAREVLADLDERSGPLTVHLNSGGGLADEGVAIFNGLRAYSATKGKVAVVNDAAAVSAASLIFMAGDTRTMRAGSFLLIHDPASSGLAGRGTEADHRQMADQLRVIASTYAEVYAARAGLDPKEARRIMEGETVLDADAAVLMGFATAKEAVAAEPVARFDYRIYAHAPEGLREASRILGKPQGSTAVLAMAGVPRSNPKETAMADETQTTDDLASEAPAPTATVAQATRAERDRAKGIRGLVTMSRLDPQVADDLIDRGVTLKAAQTHILTMLAEADLGMGGHHAFGAGTTVLASGLRVHRDWNAGQDFRTKMAAGLEARLSGKPKSEMAREAAQVSIPDLVMACARNAGLRPSGPAEALTMRGVWTTGDFGAILDTAIGNDLARQIAEVPVPLERTARVIDRPDYRAQTLLGASRTTMPEEVPEGAEIKSVTLAETGENSVKLRDFGGIYSVSRQALVNDAAALSVLADVESKMKAGAMARKRAILLEPLLANAGAGETMRDGKTLFHVDHRNVAASGSALSLDSLAGANLTMRRMVGALGEQLPQTPRFLVVPPELQVKAQQILADVNATKTSDANPFAGAFDLIVEDGLTNPTAWYLAADPALSDGLVLAFLNGQKAPKIIGEPHFAEFAYSWRMDWPMDSAMTSASAWFKNPGA